MSPWKETSVESERLRFIERVTAGEEPVTELCRQSGISRKTGYKLIHRYEAHGEDGLLDRSRAPHYQPNATPRELAERIVEAKCAHPTWGPKKLVAWLRDIDPGVSWPAPSTAGAILDRAGLVQRRRRRRRASPWSEPFAHATRPNDVWSIDFKGWFRTGDGTRVDPLTVQDAASRYLIACQGLERPTGPETRRALARAFQEYGLPQVIRTDNGPPFASVGLGSLSPLSAWPLLEAGRLAEHSGFALPRVAGHWTEGGVIWLSEIPGKNLRSHIRRGNRPAPDALLDGLERLWNVPVQSRDIRPFNLAGAYRRAKRAFTRVLPEGESGLPELGAATQALDPFVESWRPSHMAHNDFYDDQMLVLPDGRIALVDFEEAGPGDPMLDVGNFLAHLRWGAHFGREKEADAVAAFHGIFQSAALERFGWNWRELALREAVCLFRACTNAIRHPRADWRDRLQAGLSLVNETLG